jgi:hypothetical protein
MVRVYILTIDVIIPIFKSTSNISKKSLDNLISLFINAEKINPGFSQKFLINIVNRYQEYFLFFFNFKV